MRVPTTLRRIPPAVMLCTLLLPGTALAHPGHGVADNLVAGLMHPLGGFDHLLMILAVSAWAAMLQPAGRIVVACSLAFFVGVGALLPVSGGAALEAAIALTVLGAGVLLAVGRRWPLWATAALAAVFALVHGIAHGAEGPAGSGAYLLGVVLATGTLALLVSWLVAHLQLRQLWLRLAGLASAAAGALTLAG